MLFSQTSRQHRLSTPRGAFNLCLCKCVFFLSAKLLAQFRLVTIWLRRLSLRNVKSTLLPQSPARVREHGNSTPSIQESRASRWPGTFYVIVLQWLATLGAYLRFRSRPITARKAHCHWTPTPDVAALTSVPFTANKPPLLGRVYFCRLRKKSSRSSPFSHRAAQGAALQQQGHQRVKRQHLIRLQILPVLYIVPTLRLPCWWAVLNWVPIWVFVHCCSRTTFYFKFSTALFNLILIFQLTPF